MVQKHLNILRIAGSQKKPLGFLEEQTKVNGEIITQYIRHCWWDDLNI